MSADEQLLFCVEGKSPTCTFERRGCLCPACPVMKVLRLKKSFYCLSGPEQELKITF
jgi:hypothetical protein